MAPHASSGLALLVLLAGGAAPKPPSGSKEAMPAVRGGEGLGPEEGKVKASKSSNPEVEEEEGEGLGAGAEKLPNGSVLEETVGRGAGREDGPGGGARRPPEPGGGARSPPKEEREGKGRGGKE